MFEAYLTAGLAIAQIQEAKADQQRWKDAGDDPIKMRAVLDFEKQRSQRRHELSVARASAPVTNVTVRNYY